MFVHKETGRPALLRSQDESGVTFSDGQHRHHLAGHEFFGAYREATPAEIRAHDKEAAPAARKAARPAAAAAPAAKAADKPKGAPRAARAARKPKAAKKAGKADPAEPGAGYVNPDAGAGGSSAEPPKPTVRVEPLP